MIDSPTNTEHRYLPAGQAWRALAALVIGFFMILVDQTIVAVATDAFRDDLGASTNQVIWVTSAYLLAYVVPLLFTGRLGDQIGPRNVAMAGLVLFTVSSVWCGLSGSIEMLIVARVVQGLGAALLTPQSLSVISRVFAPGQRGAAMGIWGAVAGVANVVGPVAGGAIVDTLGWQWVFFVNVPFGIVAVVLVWRWVPRLPTTEHSYDFLGIALSAAGLFLLVFGIQQGESMGWNLASIACAVLGFALCAVFVWWQSRVRVEPLLPLKVFRHRNFSLGTLAVTTVGFATAGMMVPFMLYLQSVLGHDPMAAGLILLPMAVVAGVIAPFAGRLSDTVDPRMITGVGYSSFVVGLVWLWVVMDSDTSVAALMAPISLLGVANGCVWAPTSSTAMRDLQPLVAGAASGVYNTTRQVGAVLGSAAIGALMQSRIAATGDPATGIGEALLLPAAVLLVGLIATSCFRTGEQSATADRGAGTSA